MKPCKKKTAFTLLEMAAVILIIGLITVGIINGVSLLYSSRLNTARTLTANARLNDIEGLVAWYETTMIDSFKKEEVTDDAQISAWQDISASSIAGQKNRMTRTASSGVALQTKGINWLPSVRFGSSAYITLSSFYQGTSTRNTIFMVMRPTSAISTTAVVLLDSFSSGSTCLIGIRSTGIYLNAGSAVYTGTSTNAASFVNNNNYIIAAYINDTASAAYSNNATTSAGSANIAPGTNQLSGLTIGATKAGSTPFTGLISEIIIYNRILQQHERKAVMSYLSKKYNITVTGI